MKASAHSTNQGPSSSRGKPLHRADKGSANRAGPGRARDIDRTGSASPLSIALRSPSEMSPTQVHFPDASSLTLPLQRIQFRTSRAGPATVPADEDSVALEFLFSADVGAEGLTAGDLSSSLAHSEAVGSWCSTSDRIAWIPRKLILPPASQFPTVRSSTVHPSANWDCVRRSRFLMSATGALLPADFRLDSTLLLPPFVLRAQSRL